jgi:hypothetical protein
VVARLRLSDPSKILPGGYRTTCLPRRRRTSAAWWRCASHRQTMALKDGGGHRRNEAAPGADL